MSPSVRAATRVLPAPGQERRRTPGEVTEYDFKRPLKLSRENSRPLQISFETFARQASTLMTSALRTVCHFDVVDFEQLTYAEYVESLGEQTYMAVFEADPLPQLSVLQMPLAVVMTCIDRLLGGPGSADQPERPLTDLESSVVGGLFERLVAEVRYAFSAVVSLSPQMRDVEYSPQLAQLANASDAVLVARFTLRRGEETYPISLCLPFNGLLPYLTATGGAVVSERERLERERSSARLAAGLQEVPVEVSVRFRTTGADPLELSGLQVGDVVRLRHPAASPMDVCAADVVFAHATPGAQGPRLAALVVAAPTQENS